MHIYMLGNNFGTGAKKLWRDPPEIEKDQFVFLPTETT